LACLIGAAVPQASDNQVRLIAVYGQPIDSGPLVSNKKKRGIFVLFVLNTLVALRQWQHT
jgi:hypothetical protein